MQSLITIFREVRDPRDFNARHDLSAMLVVALAAALLLDNMMPNQLREAVAMVDGRAITEAPGRINLAPRPPLPRPAWIFYQSAG